MYISKISLTIDKTRFVKIFYATKIKIIKKNTFIIWNSLLSKENVINPTERRDFYEKPTNLYSSNINNCHVLYILFHGKRYIGVKKF